ncbi:MAG: NAD(P)-binding protein [Thermomonas sp.]
MNKSTLIVGAGFAASVIAREPAEAGHHVHVIDKRPHLRTRIRQFPH